MSRVSGPRLLSLLRDELAPHEVEVRTLGAEVAALRTDLEGRAADWRAVMEMIARACN